MTLRVKTDTSTVKIIPDEIITSGSPNLQVVSPTGNVQIVQNLFTKIDSGTDDISSVIKIWPLPDITSTSDDGTNGPCESCGPSGPCGYCLVGSSVHYPLFYDPEINPSDIRWDCGKWGSTARIEQTFIPTPTSLSTQYYNVYNKQDGYNILPPPPGYMMGEFTTYSVKDHIFIYHKRKNQTRTDWGLCTAGSSGVRKFVNFNRDDIVYDCSANCGDACFKDTAGGAEENYCTVTTPFQIFIQNLSESKLFDTGCIGTSTDACTSYCYGSGTQPTYHCRDVQNILPHVHFNTDLGATLLEDYDGSGLVPTFAYDLFNIYSGPQNPSVDIYQQGPLKFSDIAYLVDGSCVSAQGTAWHLRIFLPFYVSLPEEYREKFIKFNIDYDFPVGSPTDPIPANNVVQEMYKVTQNKIFAAGSIYGVDPNTNELYWGILGYPIENNHTHVVLLEVNNSTAADDCSLCITGLGTSPGYLSFYPITNSDGTFVDVFKQYMNHAISLSNGTTKGIKDLKQLTEEDPQHFGLPIGYFYKDSLPECINDSSYISYAKFINAYYQSKFNISSDSDCNCNQGIAYLFGGSGLSSAENTDLKTVTISLDLSLAESFESMIDTVDEIKDTLSGYSEGADGGEW